MKKILFVFSSLGIGGAEKMQAFVANTCAEHHFSVKILSFRYSDIGIEINKNIPIDFIGYDKNKRFNKILSIFRLRKKIQEYKPDAICVFLSDISRIVVIATTGLKIPIIASERGDPNKYGKKLKKYENAFRKCSAVVFQTEQAKKCYDLDSCKSVVIPNPCVLKWKIDKDSLKRSKKVIMSAGRFSKQKRFDVLINAFKIFSETVKGYTLKIYGSGELKDELLRQIKKLQLDDSVLLCDYVPDVFGTEGIADLFVLSSDYEGIPNVLMEAMLLDIPCVSTDCSPGGARLLFGNNGERGLLSPIGDEEALAKNMIIALTDSGIYSRLSNVSESILQDFNPEKIKTKWLEVFERVVKN